MLPPRKLLELEYILTDAGEIGPRVVGLMFIYRGTCSLAGAKSGLSALSDDHMEVCRGHDGGRVRGPS